MVWFAFVSSPLGTNLRVKKAFIASAGKDEYDETLKRVLEGLLDLNNVIINNVDDLYYIASLDPDMIDLKSAQIEEFTVARLT